MIRRRFAALMFSLVLTLTMMPLSSLDVFAAEDVSNDEALQEICRQNGAASYVIYGAASGKSNPLRRIASINSNSFKVKQHCGCCTEKRKVL